MSDLELFRTIWSERRARFGGDVTHKSVRQFRLVRAWNKANGRCHL